jgi:hypothetical protein
MADKKISELPALTTVNDSIEIPVNDGGTTKKISKLNLVAAGVVTKTSSTGSAVLPASTTANRDGSPVAGYFRWNTTTTSAEIYDGSDWVAVGGGNTTTEGLWEHSATIGTYSLTSGSNAVSAGPITVTGSVTVPASSVWIIL